MSNSNRAASEVEAYFDLYWKQRFNESAYKRRVNSLQYNYDDHLPRGAGRRVLEIGPGFGEMQEVLRERGIERVEAVDIDPQLVDALKSRGFADVRCAQDTIVDLREHPGAYDCVIALHVLEHIEPEAGRALLRAVYEALVPGGRVIIEVPNMANFITAPYARWVDYTHRNGFTQESLTSVLQVVGFEVKATFGISRPVRSLAEFAAWCGQSVTQALVWVLLKANYPQARIVAAPAITAIGVKPESSRG